MSDSSDTQRFKINAMHGHDVGVWVCEGSGLSLSPCLFMQVLCPDPVPRPLLVKWKQSGAPPKSFRSGALPLIYSGGGRFPSWPYHLHLFAPQAPAARDFEQESGLSDWHLTVPVIGLVVIFDQKHDALPSTFSLSWLINRITSANPKKNRTLEWTRAQQSPYVIAALGYEDTPAAQEQLRSRYEIAEDTPIVPGPALADFRRKAQHQDGQADSGMIASVFEPQQLTLDREHARIVMGVLYQRIERKR
jgi:hypothetical protein